jgi:hypothetical protein
MREAGRLGTDELVTETRAFAVGDLVVATRNDRSVGLVNGQAGRLVAIETGCLWVEVADREIHVSEQYVRDGHLDHAYATTAHRAQGTTVDRSFVLGSDELYREWGYTALSRHRDEARFYVSARQDFLNQAPAPLTSDGDLSGQVDRMLTVSRAEHLALDGFPRGIDAYAVADELREARERLAGVEARLDALAQEHDDTPWFRRRRRQDLRQSSQGWERGREFWETEIDRLSKTIAAQPPTPTLARAHDPLARLDPRQLPEPALELGHELERDSGMGMDL